MGKAPSQAAWKDSNLVRNLIERLNDSTDTNDEGSISFTSFDYNELFDLLSDFTVKPFELVSDDVSAITYRAFLDLRKRGRVSAAPLLAEIGKQFEKIKHQPLKRFTMWTKFRLRQMQFSPGSRFKVGKVNVRTAGYLPKWLRLDEYFISGIGDIKPNEPDFFGYVIFSTQARNENQASQSIFEAKEKFQAVINTSWRASNFSCKGVRPRYYWMRHIIFSLMRRNI